MTHISQASSQQPSSLPPSFITSFVRKCFTPELADVDFPSALTAMDYLKDLEVRRRAEIIAAMDKLGVDRSDIAHRDLMAKKYPGVMMWIDGVAEKERKIEALYSQIYVGLRRWNLINEMSLVPYNKSNCIAMLNTLYPPMGITSSQFVQPTAQLTAPILSEQRNGFFRYITAVERKGPAVLSSLMQQHKRSSEDENGWPSLRDSLDSYLRMANSIIDECNEVTGKYSPTSASFSSIEFDEEHRRKIDSGISFGSGQTSNRSSAQSHATRPSTSSSLSTHSRRVSKDKQLPEKPLPTPMEEESSAPSSPTSSRAAGSTLERIARELRKIRSRSSVRDESRARPTTAIAREEPVADAEQPSAVGKTLRLKRSLKKMRSSGGLRDTSTSRPVSRDDGVPVSTDVPAFDAEEMRARRLAWEEAHRGK